MIHGPTPLTVQAALGCAWMLLAACSERTTGDQLPPLPSNLAWGAPAPGHTHLDLLEFQRVELESPLLGKDFYWFALGYCDDRLCAARALAGRDSVEGDAAFVAAVTSVMGAEPTESPPRGPFTTLQWGVDGGGLSVAMTSDTGQVGGIETWWSPQLEIPLRTEGIVDECGWARIDQKGDPIREPYRGCPERTASGRLPPVAP